MSVAGLILAAGESRRMGRPKALLELAGETFLDRLIGLFAPYCQPMIAVLGHEPDAILPGLKRREQARIVINRDYRLGQLSSMQCGLRAVPEQAEGVLLTLVDHPNPSAATIASLVEQTGERLAIPTFEGRKGHPIYFSRQLIPEFLALPPGSQAKFVVREHAPETHLLPVDDPGILDDVDDPEAYRRLVAKFVG